VSCGGWIKYSYKLQRTAIKVHSKRVVNSEGQSVCENNKALFIITCNQ